MAPNFDKGVGYEAMVVQITGSADTNWGANIFIQRTDRRELAAETEQQQLRAALEQLGEEEFERADSAGSFGRACLSAQAAGGFGTFA